MLAERFRGVREALGRGEAWYERFDLSPTGFRASFLVAFATLPAMGVIAKAVERERAIVVGTEARDVQWWPFFLVMGAFLLAFPFVATLTQLLTNRMGRLPGWVVVRHWTLFFLVWGCAGLFALYLFGPLPYALPNFVLFVAMFALLAADIRLAQKVGGLGLGAAVLIGSTITSMGFSLVLVGLLLYIGS